MCPCSFSSGFHTNIGQYSQVTKNVPQENCIGEVLVVKYILVYFISLDAWKHFPALFESLYCVQKKEGNKNQIEINILFNDYVGRKLMNW